MTGHAACNIVPVVASNRTGTERDDGSQIDFYGSSFICGATGEIIQEAARTGNTVITAVFDLDALEEQRIEWGLFRDRRPELYGPIFTMDGVIY